MRNTMRMNSNEAYRLFTIESAEPFAHFCRGQAEAAHAQDLDGHEVAVARRAFVAGADAEFAAIDVFLLDRHDSAAAAQSGAKNPKQLGFRARQEFYDAPGVGGLSWLRVSHKFHSPQGAVACSRS